MVSTGYQLLSMWCHWSNWCSTIPSRKSCRARGRKVFRQRLEMSALGADAEWLRDALRDGARVPEYRSGFVDLFLRSYEPGRDRTCWTSMLSFTVKRANSLKACKFRSGLRWRRAIAQFRDASNIAIAGAVGGSVSGTISLISLARSTPSTRSATSRRAATSSATEDSITIDAPPPARTARLTASVLPKPSTIVREFADGPSWLRSTCPVPVPDSPPSNGSPCSSATDREPSPAQR